MPTPHSSGVGKTVVTPALCRVDTVLTATASTQVDDEMVLP